MPLTGPESVYKAYGLVRQLDRSRASRGCSWSRSGNAQRGSSRSGAGRLQIMAQRRLMLKTGAALARRLRAAALVTGDSLGQVSSQTLTNITALDDAVPLPILRPLIGLDKTEIIAEARRIGTLAISELPDQDCCSLLTAAAGRDQGADRGPAPDRGPAGRGRPGRGTGRGGAGAQPGPDLSPALLAERMASARAPPGPVRRGRTRWRRRRRPGQEPAADPDRPGPGPGPGRPPRR